MRATIRHLGPLLLVIGLSTGGTSLAAPPLPDPTRPPMLQDAPTAPNAYGLRHPLKLAAARAAEPASAPALPQLQSVHLPRQGQPSALVDGRLVRPGDRLAGPWGERSVATVDEQGLTLAPGPRERAPLRLWLLGATHPGAVAAPPAPAAPAAPNASPTPPAQLAGRSPP